MVAVIGSSAVAFGVALIALEAEDIVLTGDHFATVITAIDEGPQLPLARRAPNRWGVPSRPSMSTKGRARAHTALAMPACSPV